MSGIALLGLVVVIAIRLIVPFTIFRWPFWGVIASIVADAVDLHILSAFGWGYANQVQYQAIDKILDMYYLTFAWYVAFRTVEPLPRKVLSVLFFWRLAGVLVFALTHNRIALFLAPNIFEYFYLFIFGAKRFVPSFRIDTPKRLVWLAVLSVIAKLPQEYVMHVREYPLGLGSFWEHVKALVRTIFR